MTTFELDIRLTKIFTYSATAITPRQLTVIIHCLSRFVAQANRKGAVRLAGEALRYQALLKQDLNRHAAQ